MVASAPVVLLLLPSLASATVSSIVQSNKLVQTVQNKGKVSPVQKVVHLIEDMEGKVQKELDETTKDFEEYAKFCDDTAVEKEYAIKDGKDQVDALTATVTDSTAGIESVSSAITELSTKISDLEAELSTTTSLRTKDHENFVKTESELLETVRELSDASAAIKKSIALVQLRGGRVGSVEQEALAALVGSLGQIVEASFVKPSQRKQIAALFQQRADQAEDFAFKAHTMDSHALIETLNEMEDKASDSLTDARKREGEAAHGYAMMKQGLEGQIGGSKEEMGEATKRKAELAEKLADAQKDLVITQKVLSEDTAYLKDLKRDCQTRARDFETEAKDNQAELTALGKAKAILLKKFALVQTVMSTRRQALQVQVRDDGEDDPRTRALRAIEQLGRKLHKTALISLAYRGAADPFGKIRSMIEDMIAKLLQEAAEEATQKAFCDKEIGESTASKAEKEGRLGKINARLETAESTTAQLMEDVSKLSKEIAESDAGLAKASALRSKEKATFQAVEKDLSESEQACTSAIEVLREYYEGASLVQTATKASNRAEAKGDGSGILGVLEVAASDFAQGLAEARSIEMEAQAEYDKLLEESKMLKATKSMEIKGKQSELASLKVSISDLSEDKEGLTSELDAVLAYLDKLKPQCETKVPTYAERKAAREEEIEGLKNALQILEQ